MKMVEKNSDYDDIFQVMHEDLLIIGMRGPNKNSVRRQ